MTDGGEESKLFSKFMDAFFQDISERHVPYYVSQVMLRILRERPPDHVIQPMLKILRELNPEEKSLAEQRLISALETRIDRRWLYGLVELKTNRGYNFLLQLFHGEKDVYNKADIADALVQINEDAPVLDFLQTVIESNEPRGLKDDVMGTLSWMNRTEFEDRKMEEKYLSILYSAMSDTNLDIRLYAYNVLLSHIDMREVEPSYDPIRIVLSNEHNGKEYRRAADILRKRIKSRLIIPFSRDVIIKAITELPDNPPTLELSRCKTCKDIPDDIVVDVVEGESPLAHYTSVLETIIIVAYPVNSLRRCPTCGRLFVYKYSSETFSPPLKYVPTKGLSRVDTKGATEFINSLLKDNDYKRIIRCGMYLKIAF